MLGTQELALFALTVLLVNATPGVDMALTVASTLRGGVRQGAAAVLGISLGCVVHTLAAAFGLAAFHDRIGLDVEQIDFEQAGGDDEPVDDRHAQQEAVDGGGK